MHTPMCRGCSLELWSNTREMFLPRKTHGKGREGGFALPLLARIFHDDIKVVPPCVSEQLSSLDLLRKIKDSSGQKIVNHA